MFPIRDVNPTMSTPLATLAIIAVNLAVFFLWQPQGTDVAATEFLYENAAIACELTSGEPVTVEEIETDTCDDPGPGYFPEKNVWLAALVSMFLHGGIGHLLGNMWFLWIFGNNVEEAYGHLGYVALYLVTGFIATASFVVFNPDTTMPLVGASGAIAGVLGAYLVLFPTHKVLTLLIVVFVPVAAVVFLGLWLISQFLLPIDGVAWQAHVGGFIAGALITLPLRPMLLARVRRAHARHHAPFYG